MDGGEGGQVDAVRRAEQLLEALGRRGSSPAAGTRRCRRRRCRPRRSSGRRSRSPRPSSALVSCRNATSPMSTAVGRAGRAPRRRRWTPRRRCRWRRGWRAPARRPRGAPYHSRSRTGIDDETTSVAPAGQRRQHRRATPGSVGLGVARRALGRSPLPARSPAADPVRRRHPRLGASTGAPATGRGPARASAVCGRVDPVGRRRTDRRPGGARALRSQPLSTLEAGGAPSAEHQLRPVAATRTARRAAAASQWATVAGDRAPAAWIGQHRPRRRSASRCAVGRARRPPATTAAATARDQRRRGDRRGRRRRARRPVRCQGRPSARPGGQRPGDATEQRLAEREVEVHGPGRSRRSPRSTARAASDRHGAGRGRVGDAGVGDQRTGRRTGRPGRWSAARRRPAARAAGRRCTRSGAPRPGAPRPPRRGTRRAAVPLVHASTAGPSGGEAEPERDERRRIARRARRGPAAAGRRPARRPAASSATRGDDRVGDAGAGPLVDEGRAEGHLLSLPAPATPLAASPRTRPARSAGRSPRPDRNPLGRGRAWGRPGRSARSGA